MSERHPIIAITGSSGAGTSTVTRTFQNIFRREGITAAANVLGLKQPTVSAALQRLETSLGARLVMRGPRQFELTAAGQLFLVTARTVVEQLGEVLRHLHHLEGGQGEVMQVAAAHSLALGFFPRWIAKLRNEGLNIATRLVATNVGDAVHALREGGCDLMLAFYDPDAALQMDPEIFPSLHLGNTEMLPVCAADADGKPLGQDQGGFGAGGGKGEQNGKEPQKAWEHEVPSWNGKLTSLAGREVVDGEWEVGSGIDP